MTFSTWLVCSVMFSLKNSLLITVNWTEWEGQIYPTLPVRLCDLVASLVLIKRRSNIVLLLKISLILNLKCNGKLKDLAKKETRLQLVQQQRLLNGNPCSYIRLVYTLCTRVNNDKLKFMNFFSVTKISFVLAFVNSKYTGDCD